MATQVRDQDILLRGGLIVDGSGGTPYTANLLVRGGKVFRISPRPIRTAGVVIECAGRVVAPGFIDAHSHLDWHIPIKGHDELKYPFLAQGITTVVAGNCGMSAAGFREGSAWKERITAMLGAGLLTAQWSSVAEYVERLEASGASQNIALMAGHGSTRASIRGADPSPLHPYEIKELLWLLEGAMDQGARGVSLGLQYEPGAFARREEIQRGRPAGQEEGEGARCPSAGLRPPRDGAGQWRRWRKRWTLPARRACGCRSRTCSLPARAPGGPWKRASRPSTAALKDGIDVRFDFTPYHCEASRDRGRAPAVVPCARARPPTGKPRPSDA